MGIVVAPCGRHAAHIWWSSCSASRDDRKGSQENVRPTFWCHWLGVLGAENCS